MTKYYVIVRDENGEAIASSDKVFASEVGKEVNKYMQLAELALAVKGWKIEVIKA